MLMNILMEALMSMDDESLDYVLESCDAEELEIIDSAIEARFEDGPTVEKDKEAMKNRVIDNIDRNIDSRNAKTNKADMEILGGNRKWGKQAKYSDTRGSTTKFLGNQNAKSLHKLDSEYNALDRFDKRANRDTYKSKREELKKTFKSKTVVPGLYGGKLLFTEKGVGMYGVPDEVKAIRWKNKETDTTPTSSKARELYNKLKSN